MRAYGPPLVALGSQLLGSYDDGADVDTSGVAGAAGFLNRLYVMNPTTKPRANLDMINALIALMPMIPTKSGKIAFNFNFNSRRAGNSNFFFKSSSLCLRAVIELKSNRKC